MLGPSELRFLNQLQNIDAPEIWNDKGLSKLWLYNLHYFDDLMADDAETRRDWHEALINRWINENPAPLGNGWEPYPTSLRIVNWVKWVLAGNELPAGGQDNLATQADWLSRNLEYHLLGNHLFANAKALVFAGTLFDGPEAARWRLTGLQILDKQLPEQTLPTGGQFELSPMYHTIFVEDLLDIIQLSDLDRTFPRQQVASWRNAAERSLSWMNGLAHPDGRIAFFNDGAFGIAAEPAALGNYAARLGLSAAADRTSDLDGYVRMDSGLAVLICDAAPIGPDYLPGHAHADTLSFEMSLAGQRLIVNGGTSVYGCDPAQRLKERGTAAHNTVTLDNQNSSEIWSSFRVGRRARVTERNLQIEGDEYTLSAAHDGFTRLGGPVHRRKWKLSPGKLEIRDEIQHGWQNAKARFRIAPPFHADPQTIHGPVPIDLHTEGSSVKIENGTWAPEFGKTVPCQIVCVEFAGPNVTTTLSWQP
ncbi:MAG: heparinase II/III family protein [Paracoccaceae bacterium]